MIPFLTLSWRRPLSYRNQSIDLLCKSIDWFLYDNDPRHERVNMWCEIRDETKRHEGGNQFFSGRESWSKNVGGERSNRREDFRSFENDVVKFSVPLQLEFLLFIKPYKVEQYILNFFLQYVETNTHAAS